VIKSAGLALLADKKEITHMKHRYTRPLAIAVLLALVAAVVVLTKPTASVKAQTEGVPKASMVPSVINVGPPVTGVNHVLKGTYINTCMPANCTLLTIVPGTLVGLDAATTIHCPAPIGTTCTITDDAWIELANSSTAINNPEIVSLYVDGNSTDQFFDGNAGTRSGSAFDGLAQKTAVATKVSPGTHTVQTATSSSYGADGYAWTATYRVYVP